MTVSALEVGDWGLDFLQEFTDDAALNAQLTEDQFALALSGTIISVFAALLPMPNGQRVEANIAYVGELAGRKGGDKPPAPEIPNTPATPDPDVPDFPVDPQDDPQPASNLDFSFLDPNSKAPIPDIFQKGLPHEPPPPGSWQIGEDEGIGKTPQPGKSGYYTITGTIPGNMPTTNKASENLTHTLCRYDPDWLPDFVGKIRCKSLFNDESLR